MDRSNILRGWKRVFAIISLVLFLASGCGTAEGTGQTTYETTSFDTTVESATETTDEASSASDSKTESNEDLPPDLLAMLQKLGPHGHYFTSYFTETTDFNDEFTVQEVSVSFDDDTCIPLKILPNNWILIQQYKSREELTETGDHNKIDYSLLNLQTNESHYLLTGDNKTHFLGSDEDGHYLLFEKRESDSLLFAIDLMPYISGKAEGSDYYRANKIIITRSLVTSAPFAKNAISNGRVLYLEENESGDTRYVTFMEYNLKNHEKRVIEEAIRENFMYLDDEIFFSEFLNEKQKVLRNLDNSVSYAAPAGYSLMPVATSSRVFFMVEKEYEEDYLGTHVQVYEVFPDGASPELILETSSHLADFHSENGFLTWSHNANTIPFVLDTTKNKVIRFDGLAVLPATNLEAVGWSFAFGENAVLLSIIYKDINQNTIYKHYALVRK